MEVRLFGKTDLRVSVLGFGGSEIGYQAAPQEDVDRLLRGALDGGINVIDTAECYEDSEEKIGVAVAGRREEFNLFTKCGHASGFEEADWEPSMLAKSIERSLRRLKTDRVELMQLHTCSEEMLRKGDVIEVLRRARDEGKCRYIGYSGDRDAAAYAVACGAFDALQVSCNLADQSCVGDVLPAAESAGMGVIAKRPIANAAWRSGGAEGYGKVYWGRLEKLDFEFLHGDAAASVALRFTLAQPGICTAIVGTKNPERWRENVRIAAMGPLPSVQVDEIRARWRSVAEEDWVGQT